MHGSRSIIPIRNAVTRFDTAVSFRYNTLIWSDRYLMFIFPPSQRKTAYSCLYFILNMLSKASTSDDSTLHLPRILCLHGGGTNARIFRAQCRVLEKALKPFFRLCYAQAPYRSKPGPDVVSVYKNYAPFRAWLDPEQDTERITTETEISLRKAMAEDDMMGATGDWVGLLGFSQGAKICASLLLAQQIRKAEVGSQKSSIMPKWKFAVLLAGRGPLISATSTRTRDLLRFPTIHVHGLSDPGLNLHRKLLHENFDKRHTRLIEWDGEHRVPIKTKDIANIMEEIVSMARRIGISTEGVKW